MVVVGAGTLFAIERTLADDLLASLDSRLTEQGDAVASWLDDRAATPIALAPRLAAVTGTRITIIGADGLVQGDSRRARRRSAGRSATRCEVSRARRGEVGRAIRRAARRRAAAVPGRGARRSTAA